MIRRVIVKDPKRSIIPWWDKVEALKNLSEVSFGEGLNILWGRNGAGKSTLLSALAKLTHCDQGGHSRVTARSAAEFYPIGENPLFGVVLEHDGQAVQSVAADRTYGLDAGTFDHDFIEAAMQHIFTKGSSGQLQLHAVGMKIKDRQNWPEVRWDRKEADMGDPWRARLRQIREVLFEPRFPAGPRTILFDEPDRSLDLDSQEMLWQVLPRIAREGYQIIAATHSICACDIPGATYVELSPDYLSRCRQLRKSLAS